MPSPSDGGKVVITRNDHGVSIRINDSNPHTRYLPVDRGEVSKAVSRAKLQESRVQKKKG